MANERSFTIEAAIKCEECNGEGCPNCRFKGFERDSVKFIVDDDGKIIKVDFL